MRLARDGDPTALRAWLDTTLGSGGFPQFIAGAAHGGGSGHYVHALVRTLCGECDAAIALVPRRERDWQRYYGVGALHERAGRPREARTYFDSARARQESLGATPGAVYAKLGRKGDALQAARGALEGARMSKDAFSERGSRERLAEVYVWVGEYDAALEQLEWLLSHPSTISVPVLRVDPLYDPLRSDPRFQALLAKYDTPRH